MSIQRDLSAKVRDRRQSRDVEVFTAASTSRTPTTSHQPPVDDAEDQQVLCSQVAASISVPTQVYPEVNGNMQLSMKLKEERKREREGQEH